MLDHATDERLLTIAVIQHCGQAEGVTEGARFLRYVIGSLRSLDHSGRNDTLFWVLLLMKRIFTL